MKIKVLQGLNLKNDTTTVVAEIASLKPDLLDFFKALHPVFMIDYSIEGNTLEVQTNLPCLWKKQEFLQPIEDFSAGSKDFEEAKEEMLKVAGMIVKSMSTIPILDAAHKRGLETIQFYMNEGINYTSKLLNRYFSIGIGKESVVTVSASSSGDAYLAKKTQQDKWLTNTFIQGMDLPIAKWALVESREQIPYLAKEIGLPIVMKPVGLTGGHGVFVGLKTVKEIEETYDKIQKYFDDMESPKAEWQKKIIVQQVVKGDDFRVLVIDGKVEIATHRIPARVVGDGEHSIRELIDIENQNPARNVSLPTHTLKYIVIDDELEKTVKANGYELDDIPPKDDIVYVRKVASMSQGGITADMTDKIHPQTKVICESIAKTIHANVLGVDVLCLDISKPLTPENGCIIEMNTMPETYLNSFPVIGKQYPEIGDKVLAGLIDPNVHTNTVVVIGEIDAETIKKALDENLKNPGKVGRQLSGTIYINDYEINSGLTINSAVLSLKKNRSLDTIVLQYKDVAGLEENGLGFNEIDLLVASEDTLSPIKEIIQKHQQNGKINKITNPSLQ